MSNAYRYGRFFFSVAVTRDLSAKGRVWFNADEVQVDPSGALIAIGGGRGDGETSPKIRQTMLIFAPGKWLDCHAASVMTGDGVAVEDWEPPHRRAMSQTKEQSREKLTPTMRKKILQRDNHTCQECGASPSTGATLHIDHCVSLADGGDTVLENLRTLCASCNHGKAGASE